LLLPFLDNFIVVDIPGDGNGLFSSVAYLLLKDENKHGQIRKCICDFMEDNRDDFAPFVPDFDKHVRKMRKDRTWGDESELAAAARCFG